MRQYFYSRFDIISTLRLPAVLKSIKDLWQAFLKTCFHVEERIVNEVKIETEGCVLRAIIGCDIDHHAAKRIRESIDREILEFRPRRLVMDFSAVEFMDTSGLGLVLGRVAEAERIGATLSVEGLSHYNIRLFRMAGIEKIKGVDIKER